MLCKGEGKMKRHIMIYFVGMLLILLLAGCQTKGESEKKGPHPHLFYQNMDGTGLTMVDYAIEEKDAEAAVASMLKQLRKSPDSVELCAAIPQNVEVKEYRLEEGTLHLYMSSSYQQLDEVQEVLVRAALVQSLIQIDGVDSVDMFVEDKPLATKNGKPVGRMDDQSFVKNTGTAFKSLQKTTLTLFYSNKKGDKLIPEKEDVHYLGNVSMEKLVLEQLSEERKSNEVKRTFLPQVRILNTSVKDGICYINLGKEFLTSPYEASPEVIIYGIVNSIVSNCDVSRVQFSIEGDSTVKFMGKLSFEEPFERNIELVENE